MLGSPRSRAAWLVPLAIALHVVVVVVNAWTDDDMWITLRAVDNFVRGYGLGWNGYERVQAFTHPLWMLLLSACYFVTREGYFTTLALSLACTFAILPIAKRHWSDDPERVLVLSVLLVSSMAFVDYSTSGLENPLTHVLATLFVLGLFRIERGEELTARRFITLVLLAALGYVNRADTALLYAPTLAWLTWRGWRTGLRRRVLLRAWLVGMSPAIAWTAFAIVYFGFPVPNTAYAKLAGGHYHPPFIHPHAWRYFEVTWEWDPVTHVAIGLALLAGGFLAFRRARWAASLTLLGTALLVFYAARIGGDYMAGRLFALPYLLASLTLVELLPLAGAACWGVLAFALGLAMPRSTIRSNLDDGDPRTQGEVIDDHRLHHAFSSLWRVVQRKAWDIGRARGASPDPLLETQVWGAGATGYFGYILGPHQRVVDYHALSDALLARVPSKNPHLGWGRGHLLHDVPAGYLESVETAQNRIVDPSLHLYYEKLLLVTTGPLFTRERFAAIWGLNTGKYAYLVDEYEARRPRTR